MTKNKVIKILLILMLIDIVAISGFIYCEKYSFSLLYPRIDFSTASWTFFGFFIPIVVIEVLILTSIYLIKVKRKSELIIAIIILVLAVPFVSLSLPFWYILTDGGNWESRTTDIANFGVLDERADIYFEYGELTLDELMDFSQDEIKDYDYYYYLSSSYLVTFDISYTVEVDEQKYDRIFKMLTSEEGFVLDGDSDSGVITYENTNAHFDIPEAVIAYNEIDNSFVFKLYFHGEYY